MKKIVLLGAGASVDAGVPASTQMTERLGRELAGNWRNQRNGVVHAYNYAVGALIAHRSAGGQDPYSGIDVEQLFSAVQMLGNRDELEIAPFVEWAPALNSIGPPPSTPAFWDKDFARTLGERGGGAAREIEKLIQAHLGTRSSSKVFQQLESELLRVLSNALQVDATKTSYLEPLVLGETAPTRIATLNYDLALEGVAGRLGKGLDTGISRWRGGYDWEWDLAADVQLLKLHGSIDWSINALGREGKLPQSTISVFESTAGDGAQGADELPSNTNPGLVFGARGKVRAQGPFLAMLQAFDGFLDDAEHLVVVGYSFRDEHINVAISRWINALAGRKLTVVDPSFMTVAQNDRASFQATLLDVANYWERESQSYLSGFELEVVPQFAREGLATGLSDASAWRVKRERLGQGLVWLGNVEGTRRP